MARKARAIMPAYCTHAAVAQWIEYWPPKPRVVGSIPASRAIPSNKDRDGRLSQALLVNEGFQARHPPKEGLCKRAHLVDSSPWTTACDLPGLHEAIFFWSMTTPSCVST